MNPQIISILEVGIIPLKAGELKILFPCVEVGAEWGWGRRGCRPLQPPPFSKFRKMGEALATCYNGVIPLMSQNLPQISRFWI